MTQTYDAIVELGYRFDTSWKFPPHLTDSLNMTADLYKKHIAPLIIVCGKWSITFDQQKIIPPLTESSEMKKSLVALGVPADSIIMEENSKDTIGNAYYLKTQIVKPRDFHSLLIVCADFHAPRVEFVFKKVFGEGYRIDFQPVPTPYDATIVQSQKELIERHREFFGIMKDGEDSYLQDKLYSHPAFQK